jgi:hypothetical protein
MLMYFLTISFTIYLYSETIVVSPYTEKQEGATLKK